MVRPVPDAPVAPPVGFPRSFKWLLSLGGLYAAALALTIQSVNKDGIGWFLLATLLGVAALVTAIVAFVVGVRRRKVAIPLVAGSSFLLIALSWFVFAIFVTAGSH